MAYFGVVASKRFGRHGEPQRWFKTRGEAEQHATDLICRSQVGRSTRLGTGSTSDITLFIVKTVGVVAVPTQRVTVRNVTEDDINSVILTPTRV